jgi:uncharacterized protein YvpB
MIWWVLLADTLTVWRPERALQGPATHESRVYEVAEFDQAVPSWNGSGEFTVELRVRTGGTWQPWAVLGRWGREPRSVKHAGGGDLDVDVDTLVSKKPARAFQVRLTLEKGAEVRLVAVTHWSKKNVRPLSGKESPAWGRILDVPERSQTVEDRKIAGEICSPTSIAMVLEYHGVKLPTREVADGVFDHGAKLYGNWPFNTAYAASKANVEAYVLRGTGIEDLETEIAAGRPVVLSHRWKKGDLSDAPIPSSDGHLIVVVGFTKEGDVVVNDPAAKPGTVRRTYRRAELYTTWLERASGIVYILRPR